MGYNENLIYELLKKVDESYDENRFIMELINLADRHRNTNWNDIKTPFEKMKLD